MGELGKPHLLAELQLQLRAKYAFERSGDFRKLFARASRYIFSLNEGQYDPLTSQLLKCSVCLMREPRNGLILDDSYSLKLWTRHCWLR